jgi:hypothetical protein
MRIGYARVSTSDQNLDLQEDALRCAGCERVIVDKASGETAKRSGLDRARDLLRPGDTLVVWRLDRLGRSLRHLIELMAELERQQVGFQSLQAFLLQLRLGFRRNSFGDGPRSVAEPQSWCHATCGFPLALPDCCLMILVSLT